MKKTVAVLLVAVITFLICFNLSACSSISKSDVVGVWKNEQWVNGEFEQYMYVFSDGTCNGYGFWMEKWMHLDFNEWTIQGDYFVRNSVHKYTVKDDCMYNSQGHLVYTRVSHDVSTDIKK